MPPIVKILLNILLVAGFIFFLWHPLEYIHDEEEYIKGQDQSQNTFDSLFLDKGMFIEGSHSIALTDTSVPHYIHLYDNAVAKIYFPRENAFLKGYISLHEFSQQFPNSAKSIRSTLNNDLTEEVKTTEITFHIKNKDKNGTIPEIIVQFRKGQIDKVFVPARN